MAGIRTFAVGGICALGTLLGAPSVHAGGAEPHAACAVSATGPGAPAWVGGCDVNGRADGSGILRWVQGGVARELFAGEMRSGERYLGAEVAVAPSGSEHGAFLHVGYWKDNQPADPPESNSAPVDGDPAAIALGRGVAAATKASRHAAANYRAKDNPASARWYEHLAADLDMQVD